MEEAPRPLPLREGSCPACSHQIAVPFLDEDEQPLATLAWPATAEEARGLTRLPLEFVRCVSCGHIYNRRFDYDRVPYATRPNRMFNQGPGWRRHLARAREIAGSRITPGDTIVEIGCGEGHFLRAIEEARPGCRLIGFDPNVDSRGTGGFEHRRELFDPARHMEETRPDLLVSRHVLEHLVHPLGFLQAIAFASAMHGLTPRLFLEVPLADTALAARRTVDFYYEHNSHFTTGSFARMVERSGASVEHVEEGYGGEVIMALVRFGENPEARRLAEESAAFREEARRSVETIRDQIEAILGSGRTAVVWGGTGKAAAFMNRYGAGAERFPLVVDSDEGKVGTYVPGTGQEIRSPNALLEQPPDIIIVPMQWRAADVLAEIRGAGIPFRTILIEHEGRLVDFLRDPHPYR